MSDQLSELEGKELGCWCSPYFCHGDVLVKLVREMKDEQEHEGRKRKEENGAEFKCDPNGAQNILCKQGDVDIVQSWNRVQS